MPTSRELGEKRSGRNPAVRRITLKVEINAAKTRAGADGPDIFLLKVCCGAVATMDLLSTELPLTAPPLRESKRAARGESGRRAFAAHLPQSTSFRI